MIDSKLFPVSAKLSRFEGEVLSEFVRQYRAGNYALHEDSLNVEECGKEFQTLIRKGLLHRMPCCQRKCEYLYGLSIGMVMAIERHKATL